MSSDKFFCNAFFYVANNLIPIVYLKFTHSEFEIKYIIISLLEMTPIHSICSQIVVNWYF